MYSKKITVLPKNDQFSIIINCVVYIFFKVPIKEIANIAKKK